MNVIPHTLDSPVIRFRPLGQLFSSRADGAVFAAYDPPKVV